MQEGNIRCGRIIHYRAKTEESKVHPKIHGFININVTSANKKYSALSPMVLGQFYYCEKKLITLNYHDGIHIGFKEYDKEHQSIYCHNFENIWQGSKVYNIDLNDDKEIQSSFYERRAKMAADIKPHRRALPKSEGYPVCAYFDGVLLSYLDSRLVYCEMYTELVKQTKEYKDLVEMKNSGTNLHIIGYDGRDVEMNAESIMAAYLDETAPFGHELVLCCLLANIDPLPWTDV